MIEHLEKEINRYVIATFGTPTFYVMCNGNCNYSFTDDIRSASKFAGFNIAREIYNSLVRQYGDELVILPMKIKYVLVEPEDGDWDDLFR